MVELRQSLEQRQRLTPQQILQTVLLQLNTLDLEDRIMEELENNPVLEMEESEAEEPESSDKGDQDEGVDWGDLVNSPEDYRIRTRYDKGQEHREMPIPYRPDPIDRLLEQIRLLDITGEERRIAEEIAWNIDERGYLASDVEIIADRLSVSPEKVEEILHTVQRLDPPGLGARSLQECLRVQLEVNSRSDLTLEIVTHRFEDFANRRFEKLRRGLGCSREELNEAMDIISRLNPKPGEGAPTSSADYIVPDLIVEEVDGELVVSVNDSNVPVLRLSPVYINLLETEDGADPDLRRFLRKKVGSAHWFMQAVQQRQMTMLKVMKAIMTRQPDFFRGDTSALKPMVLKDIADRINMDISTVSRVTRGKYVQTPYGLYELKYFFSERITTETGDEVSTKIVKDGLKEVVEKEDKQHPYSDDKLAEIMKKLGYPIARRTVAKYRDQMKIPVARLRRRP
ncbi:MAG: RNA polymerase factor sigma-54 [Candidatus Neomarinimicrobiota bacterium]